MNLSKFLFAPVISIAMLGSCTSEHSQNPSTSTDNNTVVETIMTRRSVRDYLPQAVSRDTMLTIARCGINAPSAMNRQSWEIRIVDSPEFIDSITALFVSENPQMASQPNFRNMFRNAPTVAFIACDTTAYSKVDCGLMGENMILAAWSMGIGSCCLGGPVRFMNSDIASDYLKRLGFTEGYTLLYAIGFGYPAETPQAKPRNENKIGFID